MSSKLLLKSYVHKCLALYSIYMPLSGPTVQKKCFVDDFNGILEFVTSWELLKNGETHPALGGMYHGFLKLKRKKELHLWPNLQITRQKNNFISLFIDLGETLLLCHEQLWTASFSITCC